MTNWMFSFYRLYRWPLLLTLLVAGCARPPVELEEQTGEQPPPTVETPKISVPNEESSNEPLVWIPPIIEITTEEAPAALSMAKQMLDDGHLYEGSEAAIPLYLALRQQPGYRGAANTGLLKAARALLTEGQLALATSTDDALMLQQAQWDAAALRALEPVLNELNAKDLLTESTSFVQAVDLVSRVWELNDEGERELWAGRLGENGGGALARFRAAKELMPESQRTESGLVAVETALILRAEQAARNHDFATAGTWLAHARAVREDQVAALDAANRIERMRSTRISRLRAQAVANLEHFGGIHKAQEILQQIKAIADPDDLVMADLAARIETASHYGPFGPGQMFREPLQDGGRGPQMVVIAHGRFQMGAIPSDLDAHANEHPAHPVSFERGFAISVHEITVGEFGRFIRATGYQTRAARRGFSMAYDERSGNFVRRSNVDWQSDYLGNPAEPELPVLHISAHDAAAYAAWLSTKTGALYRLPSEAEFEYVLRAGTAYRHPWPDATMPPDAGNLTGSLDQSPGGRTWSNAFDDYGDGYWGPAPVGRFAANAWGVHDLAGNVSEWVADCWHASYRRAPDDGSAWVNPGCRDQVIRGGSWASSPAQTRASWRAPAPVDTTNARIGFRVVRVL